MVIKDLLVVSQTDSTAIVSTSHLGACASCCFPQFYLLRSSSGVQCRSLIRARFGLPYALADRGHLRALMKRLGFTTGPYKVSNFDQFLQIKVLTLTLERYPFESPKQSASVH